MRRSSASSLSASVPQLQPPGALQLAVQRRVAAWLQLAGATSSQAVQGYESLPLETSLCGPAGWILVLDGAWRWSATVVAT
eukprot:7385091-Prymnesium_polylepis.2